MTQLATRSIIVLLGACLLAAGGCDALGLAKPTASVLDADLQDLTLRTATLLFDVEVNNPYSTDLPLTDVAYSLASEGVEFLSGQADISGSIPAAGSKVLPIPVEIDFIQLLGMLENIVPGETIPYTADLGLMLDTPLLGLLELPVSRTGELTIPSLSDLNLQDLDLDDLRNIPLP
ncbi:MAG: LEA/WHy family protein [Planctomycetota bacterium]|jgi:LEA14-like dessication related protein